jgi:hypothetical protein
VLPQRLLLQTEEAQWLAALSNLSVAAVIKLLQQQPPASPEAKAAGLLEDLEASLHADAAAPASLQQQQQQKTDLNSIPINSVLTTANLRSWVQQLDNQLRQPGRLRVSTAAAVVHSVISILQTREVLVALGSEAKSSLTEEIKHSVCILLVSTHRWSLQLHSTIYAAVVECSMHSCSGSSARLASLSCSFTCLCWLHVVGSAHPKN